MPIAGDDSDDGRGEPPQSSDLIAPPVRLVTALGRVVEQLRVLPRVRTANPAESSTRLRAAELIYEFRRFRDEIFDTANFADPRWDMLLDLFIAAERGKTISVSSVCIAAAVPPTTALRHLSALVERGLVERLSDDVDARIVNVALTANGRARMLRVLGTLSASVAAGFQAPSPVPGDALGEA